MTPTKSSGISRRAINLSVAIVVLLIVTGCIVLTGGRPWEIFLDSEVRQQRLEIRTQRQLGKLVGRTREDLARSLGLPDKKLAATFPTGPFWGPQEKLASKLSPGQAYEEWQYRQGKSTWLIWFASPKGASTQTNRWKAVATGIHREGTVY